MLENESTNVRWQLQRNSGQLGLNTVNVEHPGSHVYAAHVERQPLKLVGQPLISARLTVEEDRADHTRAHARNPFLCACLVKPSSGTAEEESSGGGDRQRGLRS
jgi:hypothetical protein